ncbi:MAG TPA: Holliday junction resolvase [Candidatus Thermoplasmatota archaeon]|nr:Holliday junction resolvase [Candidatus Thermoplasmatota archaeon]
MPTSAIYERELKGVLGGDGRVVSPMLKSLAGPERAAYESAAASPFLVVRAAGSLGADLVALRHDLGFLIEVKSSKDDLLHFTSSPRLVEQINIIRDQCERSGVLPIYAYRLKGVRGDAWRLFTLPQMKIDGRTGLLYERLPKIETTAKGNLVLRWKNGMPLARFLDYVKTAPVVRTVAPAA